MMVYLASDYPLPTLTWNEAHPAFYVTELDDRHQPVRGQFSKPCVFYAGSHEGCGRGFQYGEYEGFDREPEDLAAAQDSRRRLAEFLALALEHQSEVELFACWDGDQAAEPEHRGRVTPADLVRDRTYFREKELLTISEAIVE